MSDSTVTFDDALPWLASAQRAGLLTPFVGAGMSVGYCRGWVEFIDHLSAQLGLPLLQRGADGKAKANPEMLYRAADRAASLLRLRSHAERREALVRALRNPEPALPEQLVALLELRWPLIVTTNFDDLIIAVIRRQRHLIEPMLLGRARKDCLDVVRSLDGLQRPIVWHVQGHLPGIAEHGEAEIPPAMERLLDELVLGHQEYQQAINAEHDFRRAFGEVFRRRSLLFLGSGLAESYMVNLISEALHAYGPSPHPHYAFLTEAEAKAADAEFLAVRLGITPVVYGAAHRDLPSQLRRLATAAGSGAMAAAPVTGLRSLTFSLLHRDGAPIEVSLHHGGLPTHQPDEDECVILSVGLDRGVDGLFTQVAFGPQAWSFLDENGEFDDVEEADFHPVGTREAAGRAPHRLFQLMHEGRPARVMGVSATVAGDRDREDLRDLHTITHATSAVLRYAGERHGRVRMGMIGSGDRRPFDPAYCLLAQLSGIRAFLDAPGQQGRLRTIDLHVFDEAAWLPLAHGCIPAAELLSSGLARVTVRVLDGKDRFDDCAISVPLGAGGAAPPTIADVVGRFGFDLNALTVSAYPFTQRDKATVKNGLLQTPVFPGMIIDVSPT